MKRFGLIYILFTFLGLQLADGQSVESGNRVALVMGNASYLSGPLRNTVNDARAMAMALESSGFEVILKENVLSQNDMKKAVREFGMKLKTGGTALFYYSGHGMQVKGFNYLIPTQAVMNIEQEIEYEALDMGFVLAYMESAKSDVNIVILDACRNNPFARSFRDTKQGLSSMVAPTGTLIAYSTSPGSVASDGEQENGLYTRALLTHMQQPGVKLEDVFKGVRADVLNLSHGEQTPWESSSLVGDFYFHQASGAFPAQASVVPVTMPEQKQAQPEAQFEQTARSQDFSKAGVPLVFDRTGTKFPFKWRAMSDGTYYLKVDNQEISADTNFEIRGEHLYVYHQKTGRMFILKYFINRLDGRWHTGHYYE
ncbi:MAG: caspase family protein [Bacteroidales bacterium]|nr:caspase family protein [Bacteroidales bacterium]